MHYRADAVEVCISDRGEGASTTRLGGSGHGLVGMRERVELYGGVLHAGPEPAGGYAVRAHLPLGRDGE